MNIVFVCNANMFRSVSGHYCLNKYLKDNNISGVNVSSAGICAPKNKKTSENVIANLKKFKIDATSHRSRQFDREILDDADLVVAMSKNHQEYIEKEFSIHVPLFNEIAFNKSEGIADNNEVIKNPKENMKEFNEYESKIINYINDSIPSFVKNYKNYAKNFKSGENCKFCRFINKIDNSHNNGFPFIKIYETTHSISFLSTDIPKNENLHILVIPKKHHEYLENIPENELSNLMEHLKLIITQIRKTHGGCNILLNDGGVAGQYIFHSHFHLFPRDNGDNMEMESWERDKISKKDFILISENLRKKFK